MLVKFIVRVNVVYSELLRQLTSYLSNWLNIVSELSEYLLDNEGRRGGGEAATKSIEILKKCHLNQNAPLFEANV